MINAFIYDDGTDVDVPKHAIFSKTNESIAVISIDDYI